MKNSAIRTNTSHLPAGAELRASAEARLRAQRKNRKSKASNAGSKADLQRVSSELQVHQVELEMQNAELQAARDRQEALLDNYTDLYDFAPIGYASLDEQGLIMELNLTGAALLGMERARLIGQRLPLLVVPSSRPVLTSFLKGIFSGTGADVCKVLLSKKPAADFWARFRGVSATSLDGQQRWCRVAFWDITIILQAEETEHRLQMLTTSNQKLEQEIVRRKAVEQSLKVSEQHQIHLLEQARLMQEQLRHLSRRILLAQEEERKRISRELHDVIAQMLTGINMRLATLNIGAKVNAKGLGAKIAHTQRLVEKSVDIVHRFARELRPSVLDDLGLIPALHSHLKDFGRKTGIRIHLEAFAGVESINMAKRTALYRVAQEALANIERHAHADRVDVNIQRVPDAICMEIRDNGRGFNPTRVLDTSRCKRLGILGIRERVEMVGGQFSITSAPGKGTTIRAQLPINNDRTQDALIKGNS